tara:strand:- start:762 stop:881 length:120 start_codon:yes stop_codon:yes gene_type:complete
LIIATIFGVIFDELDNNYNPCPQYCATTHEHIIEEKDNE